MVIFIELKQLCRLCSKVRYNDQVNYGEQYLKANYKMCSVKLIQVSHDYIPEFFILKDIQEFVPSRIQNCRCFIGKQYSLGNYLSRNMSKMTKSRCKEQVKIR